MFQNECFKKSESKSEREREREREKEREREEGRRGSNHVSLIRCARDDGNVSIRDEKQKSLYGQESCLYPLWPAEL